MKQHGWTVALVSGLLALSGCGGGSSSSDTNLIQIPTLSPPQTPTPAPTPTGPYMGVLDLTSLRFTKQASSFVGELPYMQTATTSHAVIDVNGDGFLDIVFAFWTGLGPNEWGANVGDRPTPNKIAIFINEQGRQFVDRTDTYLIGGNDLGGATRKVEKVDLNGDGRLDLVFAVNREDGRSGSPGEFNSSQSAALISQERGYQIYKFGERDWHHNVVTGKLSAQTFVIASGFVGSAASVSAFGFAGGQLTKLFQLPFQISPNTAKFASDGAGDDTNILIQTQIYPNLLGIEAWVRRNGAWSKFGQVDNPFEFVKNVEFITYNGDKGTVPVYKAGDNYILGGGGFAITESRLIKVVKDGPSLFLAKMETPIIPNFNASTTILVKQDDLIGQNRFVFYDYTGGSLSVKNISVIGEKRDLNYNFISVFDIDRDGFEDIVKYPYSRNGSPVIYRNNGAGGFSYQAIQDSSFFQYHRDTATPIIGDFNNDGYFDIVTIPANGNDLSKGRSMADYLYYTGSRN